MNFFIPAVMEIGAPLRGAGTPAAGRHVAQSLNASFAWGSAPGSATAVYVSATGITRGARVTLRIGAHFFAGICQSDTANDSSGGQTRTLQFVDFRDYLTWDYVFCAFNRAVRRTVNGRRVKQYRQVYPVNANLLIETYTDAPLSAGEMVAAILIRNLDNCLGSPQRKQHSFTEGLLADAPAVVTAHDGGALKKFYFWLSSHRDRPTVPRTAEQLLRDFDTYLAVALQ